MPAQGGGAAAAAAGAGAGGGSMTLALQIPKKHHTAVIGKGGANTKRLQSEFGVRTSVPKAEADSTEVTLTGPAAAVASAKAALEQMLGFAVGSAPVVSARIEVDKKRHGALIGPQATVLKQIEQQSGGCALLMPDRASDSPVIQIDGSAPVVEAAIAAVEKILNAKVKRLSAGAPAAADVKSAPAPPAISYAGLSITSRGGVDLARISVAKRAQHVLIGSNGVVARRLTAQYDVRVRIPGAEESSTDVTVQGAPDAVRKALADIAQLLGVSALTSDPLVTAYLGVPKQSHGALIGTGGSVLQAMEQQTGARFSVPKKDEVRGAAADVVTVEGTAAQVAAAKAAVEKIVQTKVEVSYAAPGGTGGAADQKMAVTAAAKVDLKGVKSEALFFPDVENAAGSGSFNRFLSVLRSATKTACVAIFTLTDDRVSRVLEDLHNSGVDVRIVTESSTVNDTGSDVLPLCKLGVPIKVDVSPYLMHHKFAVLDGAVVITGSFNWTRAASVGNNENVVILPQPDIVRSFDAEFGRLWSAGAVLTQANAPKLCVPKGNK